MTTAFYEWKQIAGSISISLKEKRQNAGEGQMINLLESKLKQAQMTMTEELNSQLLQGALDGTTFVPASSTKGLNPLGYFCPKLNGTDPTSGGDIGNISSNTYDWWRCKTSAANGDNDTGNSFSNNVTTYAALKANVRRMHNFTGRGGGGKANLLVGDQISFETYENALDVNVRFTDTSMADLGFSSVKVQGATFIYDEIVPDIDGGNLLADGNTGTIFFIHTGFYKFYIDTESDIVITPFQKPAGTQLVDIANIYFMGNATVSSLRKHGVLYAISQSITS